MSCGAWICRCGTDTGRGRPGGAKATGPAGCQADAALGLRPRRARSSGLQLGHRPPPTGRKRRGKKSGFANYNCPGLLAPRQFEEKTGVRLKVAGKKIANGIDGKIFREEKQSPKTTIAHEAFIFARSVGL